MKELHTPGGEHHEIGDEEGLVMMMATNPPLRSPKWTPNLASMKNKWRRRLCIVKRDETSSRIVFLGNRNL